MPGGGWMQAVCVVSGAGRSRVRTHRGITGEVGDRIGPATGDRRAGDPRIDGRTLSIVRRVAILRGNSTQHNLPSSSAAGRQIRLEIGDVLRAATGVAGQIVGPDQHRQNVLFAADASGWNDRVDGR